MHIVYACVGSFGLMALLFFLYRLTQPKEVRTKTEEPSEDCVQEYLNMKSRPAALIATGVPVADKSGHRVRMNVMFLTGVEATTETLYESVRILLQSAESLVVFNSTVYNHNMACRTELRIFINELVSRFSQTRELKISREDGQVLAFFRIILGEDLLMETFRQNKDHNQIGVANFMHMIRENWTPVMPDKPLRDRARTAIRVHTSRRQRTPLPGNAS